MQKDGQNDNSNNGKSVVVLDSGIGGMTVVKAIRDINNTISVNYISDNAFFPYGGLETAVLIDRVRDLVAYAIDHFSPQAIVIACNTASTLVLDDLGANFSVPIVGVVPPIKTAGEVSRSHIVGLLATEGTVQRSYLDKLTQEFAPHCQIHRVQCPDLAPMAEAKVRGLAVDKPRLRAALRAFQAPELAGMDVVILGCTHYPILRDELMDELPGYVQWLDPALPVARQLDRVLAMEGNASRYTSIPPTIDRRAPEGGDTGYFTGDSTGVQDNVDRMKLFLEDLGFAHAEALWRPHGHHNADAYQHSA